MKYKVFISKGAEASYYYSTTCHNSVVRDGNLSGDLPVIE